ncbi:response regulator transcription factor [Kordiimonas sp. SCSIO 12603]|uniref:LytR/AlgR family response regulator transcription factor n=1 Tax=Kordiimonas sp. SCSIO 12603 TaxID=2829596 RepID=UPI0021083163|nr:LytTR family DNA-binding domain-containing protein [Kordiimonas sp. SCSIO 12603]UTW59935.1 response regulator transcription factor [Kordiimonas sp. SCSIO 12603]
MTKLRCLILEDQLPAQRVLKNYITRLDGLKLVATCSSAAEASVVLSTDEIDVLFLDIHLPKMDGFSFLKSLDNPPHVIVTTAYSEHAVEGFELAVVDYLLKPFSFDRFEEALNRLPDEKDVQTPPQEEIKSLFIKVDGDYLRLDLDKLVHIASDGNFLHINTADARHYILGTLQSWADRLPQEKFVRVHKSHIVNMDYVERISGNQLFTASGSIPIGRAFKDGLLAKVMN